jgi:malonyl CoA-acyl carrier protein transacylase
MAIPVWSNDTGEDLRTVGNIIDEVMRAYFLCPAIWRRQIKPLLPPTSIRYVLDFGPGTGVASLSENHCAGTGIQVVRCAIPLGRKKLFDEVLPALGG